MNIMSNLLFVWVFRNQSSHNESIDGWQIRFDVDLFLRSKYNNIDSAHMISELYMASSESTDPFLQHTEEKKHGLWVSARWFWGENVHTIANQEFVFDFRVFGCYFGFLHIYREICMTNWMEKIECLVSTFSPRCKQTREKSPTVMWPKTKPNFDRIFLHCWILSAWASRIVVPCFAIAFHFSMNFTCLSSTCQMHCSVCKRLLLLTKLQKAPASMSS